MGIYLSAVYIVFGFAGLIWSADRFVLGASTTARNLGVSPLVIGLTIVAFGTSAPEIFTSATASLQGSPSIAIGNAIGSNIANLGIVLAITVLIHPIEIPLSLMKKELPALLGVSAICFVIFADFTLNYFDGVLLLFLAVVFIWCILKNLQVLNVDEEGEVGTIIDPQEISEDFIGEMSTPKALTLLFFGLILLIISANILVEGARSVATTLGISELIIGLTVMAIGTSLPELATSMTSALKGHYGLVLGNIIGSNIMNILLVLPVPALISPVVIQPVVLTRDYATMMIITLGCAYFLYMRSRKKQRIGRVAGTVLLTIYIAYTALLIIGS
ncbi:MAG: calcium/sodium antiporter [Gammaproteobacteria bacterium]|nr:calcium/sodium antiporter [Gammaproteobacteria bacterium]